MPILALATAGALLVASPAWMPIANTGAPKVKTPEPTWYAEQGGVVLGNALRCGVAADRVFKGRELVEAAIGASARDEQDAELNGALCAVFNSERCTEAHRHQSRAVQAGRRRIRAP